MRGQWLGGFSGTNNGNLIIEVDDAGRHYEGTAYVVDQSWLPHGLAITGHLAEMPKGEQGFALNVPICVTESHTGRIVPRPEFEKRFPGFNYSDHVATRWDVSEGQISIDWSTPLGTAGKGIVTRKPVGNSQIKANPDVRSWSEFKDFAIAQEPDRYVYRGQRDSKWAMRTAFHRAGRFDLRKFIARDLPVLQRHLSGMTTHRFNCNDELDFAAFVHLVQHHGYPTPLLDWTYSPFIAAYFAFKGLKRLWALNKVRILMFDAREWGNVFERARFLNPPFQHVSLLEPLAMNNPRMIPQKAISTYTNVDDIEAYIARREAECGKTFLTAIDLPANECRVVLSELGLMGVSAGALFPGLDGVCEELRDRFFNL